MGFDFLSTSARGGADASTGDASGDGDSGNLDGSAPEPSADGSPGPAQDGSIDPPPPSDAGVDDAGSSANPLRIAALPYVASDSLWADVIAGAPSVSVAVLNPNSGVGSSMDLAFAQRTSDAQAAGISVLGYVTTSYAARSLAAAKSEIDQYESWYAVDGYFVDQATSGCVDVAYYQELFDYIKQKSSNLTVVLDPGINVPECYAAASDILVTFQDTLSNYETFAPSGWESGYPRARFWHLVYDAATVNDMEHAFDLAATRNVGFIYVTDDTQPNPWDTLPGSTYWAREIERAAP